MICVISTVTGHLDRPPGLLSDDPPRVAATDPSCWVPPPSPPPPNRLSAAQVPDATHRAPHSALFAIINDSWYYHHGCSFMPDRRSCIASMRYATALLFRVPTEMTNRSPALRETDSHGTRHSPPNRAAR